MQRRRAVENGQIKLYNKGSIYTPSNAISSYRLRNGQYTAEKVKVLQQCFYPSVEADLTDITDTIFDDSSFKDPLTINCTADTQEVLNLLRTRRANRAPGSNSIPNDFLKAMEEPLAAAVAAITSAC